MNRQAREDWDTKALNINIRRAPFKKRVHKLGYIYSPLYHDPTGNKMLQQATVYEMNFGRDRSDKIPQFMRAIGKKTATRKDYERMKRLKFVSRYDELH